jgi:glucokinase
LNSPVDVQTPSVRGFAVSDEAPEITDAPDNPLINPGPDAKYWVGFDLGGTKMHCALFDEQMRKVGHRKRRTRQDLGVEGGLERIAETVLRLTDDLEILPSQIAGIGIGCPGPVEWDKGLVRVAVNLGWVNVKVGSFMEKKFNCPVAVLNDVDAGVYGEHTAGAGMGARSTVGIFPGTGIGGGCVYDGQILRGKRLSCMEIGHIKISGSGRTGGSCMTGTLEAEASRLAIAAEVAKLAYRGEAPNLHAAVGCDLGAIRSKVIFEAIAAGDVEVEKVLMSACETIGQAIANIVLLICPDCVVLGGGLVDAMPERFLKHITAVARSSVFECYRDQFEVRLAKLGDDAGAVGCASWIAKIVTESKSRKSP